MKTLLILAILSLTALSENITQKQLERLKNKKNPTYEDLAHENPGCPENSICSEQMGKKMKKWNDFSKKLTAKKTAAKTTAQMLEAFRKKNGLPISFLTTRDSVLGLDPVLYTSRCAHHNPKDKSKTVYRGIQFFRNDPRSESVSLDPVIVYNGKDKKTFRIPYEESPLLIKNGQVVVIQEREDLFYHLSISTEGKWKVINLEKEDINQAMRSFENAQCPEEDRAIGANHLKSYCKKVWDDDLKKELLVKLAWSCP